MSLDDDLLRRDAETFLHQEGSTPCLHALRSAAGIWLEDVSGNRFIDLHGNTCHHIGHAHPRLIAAIKDQIDLLAFSPRRYTNEPAILLAESLTRRFLGGRSRLLLATGGSDAIEIALRLARVATRRSGIIALEGSYHGHGFGSLALSSRDLDARLGSQMPAIHHVTPYWDAMAGGADRMLADVKAAFATARDGIACLIGEPMRSNCIVPPAGLWPEISNLCKTHGAKLIFDEIPSGLGKTGRFFAHEHFEVIPDIVVLGKALGGGILPIAAVLADTALDVAPELALGHYTHEKNPLTSRAALTTLQIIDEEGLVARAENLGRFAEKILDEILQCDPNSQLSGIRGLGLLRAIILRPDGESRGMSARHLVEVALLNGISTTLKGRDAIGFSPPMIISEHQISFALKALARAARV